MERHIDAREGNSRDATLQSDIATLSSLLLFHSLEAVVDDILLHALNLLDGESFQELLVLRTQLISVPQYNIRKNLSCLLEVNIFLLQVIENIRDSLQPQKVACRDVL